MKKGFKIEIGGEELRIIPLSYEPAHVFISDIHRPTIHHPYSNSLILNPAGYYDSIFFRFNRYKGIDVEGDGSLNDMVDVIDVFRSKWKGAPSGKWVIYTGVRYDSVLTIVEPTFREMIRGIGGVIYYSNYMFNSVSK